MAKRRKVKAQQLPFGFVQPAKKYREQEVVDLITQYLGLAARANSLQRSQNIAAQIQVTTDLNNAGFVLSQIAAFQPEFSAQIQDAFQRASLLLTRS